MVGGTQEGCLPGWLDATPVFDLLLAASIELQVGTYGCSMYSVPYNFFQKAYNGML